MVLLAQGPPSNQEVENYSPNTAGRQAGAIIHKARPQIKKLRINLSGKRAGSGLEVPRQQGAAWVGFTGESSRKSTSFSFSVTGVCEGTSALPPSRNAARRSDLGKRALCLSSPPSIQFTFSNNFTKFKYTPHDPRSRSQAPMSLQCPRRYEDMVLTYCFELGGAAFPHQSLIHGVQLA